MRLIDADALAKKLTDWSTGTVEPIDWKDIAEAPTIDAVEVVRCKDCRHYESDGGAMMICDITYNYANDDDFCSYGERASDDYHKR